MLTFTNISMINFIALSVAEETNDNNKIEGRLYNNNVELYYTINNKKKIIHILYIESHIKRHGNATEVLKSFLSEFSKYTIVIEAIYYLETWYQSFGFISEYAIDDMFAIKMKLSMEEENGI